MTHKCTHPDHNEHETCEDRAVGCHKDCECCIPKVQPLDDICVRDASGCYVDVVWNCATKDWSVLYMDSRKEHLTREDAEMWMRQILLGAKVIEEIIWDEEIGDARKFE
jgi:hypothetical protein